MELPRSFGIVLHPTSLPGPWGIGTLGAEAHRFLAWLSATGAQWWQVLPLGPTGYGDSPYQSFSAVAGNPYLLDPTHFVSRGWMRGQPTPSPADRVDFGWIYTSRWPLLREAYTGFLSHGSHREKRHLARFVRAEATWLPDYALFMALKAHFRGDPWPRWPAEVAHRARRALSATRRALADDIRFHAWTQWQFHLAWATLRTHASDLGIRIIGDMPIFAPHDSVEVWTHPELFRLDVSGQPTVVAGVPPDYFSVTGQRWGNPLYQWDVHAADGFRWWIARVRHALRACDLIRLDHFRGLASQWEIPATELTAIRGRWITVPGQALLTAIRNALGDVPIVAEDLGVITPDVEALRDRFGLPGMRVLQFAFNGEPDNPHLPANFPEHGRVLVYTGTHDNDTALGWFRSAPSPERERALAHIARHGIVVAREEEIPQVFIQLAFASRAALALIPLQDVLAKDTSARMNTPGKEGGNWTWRCTEEELTGDLASTLRQLAAATGRVVSTGTVR